jgi:prophage antirepressor-like protein
MKTRNQIQQFHNDEFGSLEILMIDDKPYFPAIECAALLGYSTPRHAVTRHCKEGMKRAVLTNGACKQKVKPQM